MSSLNDIHSQQILHDRIYAPFLSLCAVLSHFSRVFHSSEPSCFTLCDPMDSTLQAPLSMGCSRQGCWSGFPCPSPGDLPDPGIEPTSPIAPALADGFFITKPPGKPLSFHKADYFVKVIHVLGTVKYHLWMYNIVLMFCR